MSWLQRGLSTFNMCNKAGSIPYFTRHLQSNPTDYQALMWRGQANHIEGNIECARADFQAAERFSSGPKRYVAQYFVLSTYKDEKESRLKVLQEAVSKFPDSYEVLGLLGTLLYEKKQYSESLGVLTKAVKLIESRDRIEEPSYCWHKHTIGSIYLHLNRLDEAEGAFRDAINFSESHTVSHLGLAKTQIAKGKNDIARQHFDKAKSLNPSLVPWANIEAFQTSCMPDTKETIDDSHKALSENMEDLSLNSSRPTAMRMLSSDPTPESATSESLSWWELLVQSTRALLGMKSTKVPESSRSKGTVSGASTGPGRSGGNDGDNSGSGSDDEDKEKTPDAEANEKWKQIKKESREILKYRGKEYVLSKDGKHYYSRDKAGHGGSFLKVYVNKNSSLEFKESLDRNFKPMPNKHESMKGTSIKKSAMDVVRRR